MAACRQRHAPMLMSLFKNPQKGLLHGEFFWNTSGTAMIQYWKSFEDLEKFAREPSDPHQDAWKKFTKADPDEYECVYGNMPQFGLGATMQHVPAVGTGKLRG